jgi:hypothetical protein
MLTEALRLTSSAARKTSHCISRRSAELVRTQRRFQTRCCTDRSPADSPVVDAAGRRRRFSFGTPRGPTLSRQPSRAVRAKGRALARRGTRLPLARASTVALRCFPLLPHRFPSFPPLAAWVGMPVNRHE